MLSAVISHPVCAMHEQGEGHPEQPARIQVIQDALKQGPLVPLLQFYEATKATRRQLLKAHDAQYIEQLERAVPTQGYHAIDADTKMNANTLEAAQFAAGAVVRAVDLVLKGKHETAFCNIRPPGHHAGRAAAGGFCFFNNVAVGVLHALGYSQIHRVAIIDFDVHHGNGTEDIFKGNDNVLLLSSFEYPLFPGHPHEQYQNIVHETLQSGDAGDRLEEIFAHWQAKLKAFKPDIIFISAGFDAHRLDPIANINLEAKHYYWAAQEIAKLAKQYSHNRVISCLEGGYSLTALRESVTAHLQGLIGLPLDLEFLKDKKNFELTPGSQKKAKPLTFLHNEQKVRNRMTRNERLTTALILPQRKGYSLRPK